MRDIAKIRAMLLTLAIGVLPTIGCVGDNGDPGTSVTISPGTLRVTVGDTATLTVSSTLEVETFTWTSSDPAVVTVDTSGTVTGVTEGAAIVAAIGNTSGVSGLVGISIVAAPAGPVSFATDILPLFTTKDVWFTGGAACNAKGCHTGIGGAHDLDMGSHAGVILGADAGLEPILDMTNPDESSLRKRMRNNRMPWGIPPIAPRNGPRVKDMASYLGWVDASSLVDTNGLVKLVEAWIDTGAANGTFNYVDSSVATVQKSFAVDILPLFNTPNVWWSGTESCAAAGCHNGVGGAHDLDMSSYAGIILGADAGAEPILVAGNSDESALRKRLRNNRMPWGMPTWVPRNGPNGEVADIVSWITSGAPNN